MGGYCPASLSKSWWTLETEWPGLVSSETSPLPNFSSLTIFYHSNMPVRCFGPLLFPFVPCPDSFEPVLDRHSAIRIASSQASSPRKTPVTSLYMRFESYRNMLADPFIASLLLLCSSYQTPKCGFRSDSNRRQPPQPR